ncbi:hypothetical protein [Sorangium cellulosum]|uniref:hypothetical protein n=1 Tax=Sorangium cellulosum TaxID=56 RepID=UPI0012FF93FD|nr:hypothetical protein [Sorangium cellulosum]
MGLVNVIDAIRRDPGEYLTEACVLALGAFLFGYRMVNENCAPVLRELTRRFEGADQADACTRAYLSDRNTERALRRVLEALGSMLAAEPALAGSRPANTQLGFMELVRDPIVSGRTGMVFAEPTVDWCANFWKGFLAGLDEVDPTAALQERERFDAFEQWLAERYAQSGASWYAMIRVFEGADLSGLRAFVALWEEFRKSVPGAE